MILQDTQKEEGPWERLPEENARAYQILVDEKITWGPCPNEPARAYAYAWQYFMMGPPPARSLEKLQEKLSEKVRISVRQLKRYSKAWQWGKRADDYDRWIAATNAAANLKAAVLVADQTAERDAQRAQALRERKYQQSQQLLDQADNMNKSPLFEVKRTVAIDESGRATQIQIIKPAKWSKGDVLRYLELGHTMGRESTAHDPLSGIEEQDVFDDLTPYVSELKRE
jgi:hypothetical protein